MRLRWGVLIYKSDYDLDVTLVQPRDVDFRSRTIFIGLNFFAIRCARVKNIPFNFLVFQRKTERNAYEVKNYFWYVQNIRDFAFQWDPDIKDWCT